MENIKKKQNLIPLKDLNLTNRFLFDQVMEDPHTQQNILSIVFGREIPLLSQNESEKEIRLSPLSRSVRMDIYSVDEDDIVYATEMQTSRKKDLAKRSRYYQSIMDTALLEPGVPDYNLLNNTYLIMFMTFDLFGYKKYCYTFRPRCEEVPECELSDGTTRIFLNMYGENKEEVSEELIALLHYLRETTDEVAKRSKSRKIQQIHERVCKVKVNEAVGVKYMQAWEERYFDKQEAREEGHAEGHAEGLAKGLAEGLAEGERRKLKELVMKKMNRGMSAEEIADMLEEEKKIVAELMNEISLETTAEDE